MKVTKNGAIFTVAVLGILGFVALFGKSNDAKGGKSLTIRVAYMPNLTHAPAVYGFQSGSFQAAVPEADLKGITFNAGPEEMEALRAGGIDIAFVGPGPVTQNLAKGSDSPIVLLEGSCEGGASLVSRPGLDIKSVADLGGHSVAVPQLGGSQDISLRHFLKEKGLAPAEKGGTVQIIPVKNADLPLLFSRGQVDAAWVPEPWGSILRVQHGAKLVVDERDLWPDNRFPTTMLVASRKFAKDHPDAVRHFQAAHAKTIATINQDRSAALGVVGEGLDKLTGKKLPKEALASAWNSLAFSTEVLTSNLQTSAETQFASGYIKKVPPGSDWLAAGLDGANGR